MKIFDKYFKPYAEYCIRTAFSEEELKAVFENELPSYNNLFSVIKTGFDVKIFVCGDPGFENDFSPQIVSGKLFLRSIPENFSACVKSFV